MPIRLATLVARGSWRIGLAIGLTAMLASAGALAQDAAPRASCSRVSGPTGITAVQWSDAAAGPTALERAGFGVLKFAARDGKLLTARIYRPSRFDPVHGPLWFVMHGIGRNAGSSIDAAAAVAERYQSLAIAIEFPDRDYPSSEQYTLGVVTRGRADKDALREGRWRKPQDFLYNEIERVFEAVRLTLKGRQSGYYMFGHSAGAQFTHRLLTFVPCARVLGAVAANAGWYTLPTADEKQGYAMPYSLGQVPAQATDVAALLSAPLTLLLGDDDTRDSDDDSNVRGTSGAMAQGVNRLARGRHYFETGKELARSRGLPFGWNMRIAPGAGHDARQVIASAGYLLFAGKNEPVCEPTSARDALGLAMEKVLVLPSAGSPPDADVEGGSRARDDTSVRIRNAGSNPVCLAGWTLKASSGRGGHLFPLGRAIRPGHAVVVVGGGVPTGDFEGVEVQRATSARGLALQRSGDVLTLRDADGKTVRRMPWGPCGHVRCTDGERPDGRPPATSLLREPRPGGAWSGRQRSARSPGARACRSGRRLRRPHQDRNTPSAREPYGLASRLQRGDARRARCARSHRRTGWPIR